MTAVFSPCGLYRYRLEREIQMEGIVAALFGVNPSKADATINDNTISKEIGFAKLNGWRRIIKGNAFAYVATNVREVAKAADPIGPNNLLHLARIVEEADVLVPCWGDEGKVPARLRGDFGFLMARLLRSGKPVLTFGLTANGSPKHPLMLSYSTQLVEWRQA
jgi:hypothetical protein